MTDIRVASISITAFRGIRDTLTLDLRPAGVAQRPTSMIIFGDNGSGKSSIVDAIEWACQAKIGRRQVRATNSYNSHIVNLAGQQRTCAVHVALHPDGDLRRSLTLVDSGPAIYEGSPVPDSLAIVPMSLKRADILRFLDTPPEARGALFFDHALSDLAADSQSGDFATQSRREEETEVKRRIRSEAAILAGRLGVHPPPHDAHDIDDMIAFHAYRGVSPADRHRVQLNAAVSAHIRAIERARRELTRVGRRNQRAQQREGARRRIEGMGTLLQDVSEWMTESFLSITGVNYVTALSVSFGRLSDASLEVEVDLSNGYRTTPQQVFSEGYQDLVALLFFLATSRAGAKRGEARILILDDVLQSVDATIRVSVMELVVREFRDWQLLVTVHDRLWRTQLRDIFQRIGHPVMETEIRRWDFVHGPLVGASSAGDIDAPLWGALSAGDPATVCGVAGRLLEQVADRLSWTIPFSVKRKRGDAYTLADLWPGAVKGLRSTTAGPAFAEVDKWLHLRNAVGAHYNEWAEVVTWAEAESFGLATLELLSTVRCNTCGSWVERSGPKSYACRCGDTWVQSVDQSQ